MSPQPEQQFLVTERQLSSLRHLYALGEGWPFGSGPMEWFCHTEVRNHLGVDQVHMVCDQCPQAIFCLMPDLDKVKPGFTWNLELLKSRVADHVLKCHPDAASESSTPAAAPPAT